MDREKKYRLSFTGASLMLPEMSELAKAGLEQEMAGIDKSSVVKGQRSKTISTQFREIKLRIDTLTGDQLEILANGDMVSQRQIALLSICKAYAYIRDFVVEVVREKAIVFDYQLTEGEYVSFFRRKSQAHPELENLTENTAKKVRQVTFKFLEQTGLIDNVKSRKIIPQLVDEKVARAVVGDDPEWLKIYLMPDMEVANRAS
ncbi:DUF1819 family protein [Pontibacter sp. Tf4]|uniref:DUF1819 family protein n=1 Tax=Pontibacter sp. Tf4 TaxID=2761620 RepID=UPI00162ACBB4|nr:DUF1819 family protein [Pontibacter sp. Tf4]MBB6610497.1 DUF1819 family protein [Pontibacter sp. Tf4]